jgi:hypothetical protein
MALNVGSIIGFVGVDNSDYLSGINETIRAGEKMAKTMERQFKAVGRSMQDLGRTMSIAVTAPIVAAAGAMTKAAVDANETRNKFNVVFRDIAADANRMAEVLRNSYGLGSVESRKLLGDTGDLLTGFGFTQESALNLSNQVQRLAADLASFTNIEGGVAKASKALTAALTGETEQAKALGIIIRQDSAEYKGLVEQYMTVNGLSLLQAKAQTALTIALKQSKNAIGDVSRTFNDTANSTKRLWKWTLDEAEALGQRLIPALDKAVAGGFRLLTVWKKLSTQTQDLILRYAGMAAAFGPALLIIGKLTVVAGSLFGIIGTGLGTLASFAGGLLMFTPIALGVALGVALMVDAFGALIPSAKTTGKTFVWLQGIWKETANFWEGVVDNILGNTKVLTDGQKTAVEFIAKVWLGLKFAWNAVVVGLQTVAVKILGLMKEIVLSISQIASFVGLEALADKALDVAFAIDVGFAQPLKNVREANLKTMKEITDSWGKAPDILRADVQSFKTAVSEIGEQALEGIKGLAPEAVAKIQGLIEQINSALAAGEAGAVELPIDVAKTPAIVGTGAEMAPGTREGIEEFFDIIAQKEFETLVRLAEDTRTFQEENLSAWDQWAASMISTFDSVGMRALDFGVSLVKGISAALSQAITSTATFAEKMTKLMSTMGQKLLDETIDIVLQVVAWQFASAEARAAGSAPNPWLIPVYAAAAAALFSAAMANTIAGSSSVSGAGGASASAEPGRDTRSRFFNH